MINIFLMCILHARWFKWFKRTIADQYLKSILCLQFKTEFLLNVFLTYWRPFWSSFWISNCLKCINTLGLSLIYSFTCNLCCIHVPLCNLPFRNHERHLECLKSSMMPTGNHSYSSITTHSITENQI